MIKNIFSLFLILCLSGCGIFYKYGVYKAQNDSINANKMSVFRYGNLTNYFSISIDNKIQKLKFYTNSMSFFTEVLAFTIIPIAFLRRSDAVKVEDDNNYFVVYIEELNDISFLDLNTLELNEETVNEIELLSNKIIINMKKDGKIYKSTLNMPKAIKLKSKDVYFYRKHIKYEFPIKIKDIGKEGAILIIEYNGIKKEIPFVYKYGWMYR